MLIQNPTPHLPVAADHNPSAGPQFLQLSPGGEAEPKLPLTAPPGFRGTRIRSRGAFLALPKGSSEACGQAAASWEAQAMTRASDGLGGVRGAAARGFGAAGGRGTAGAAPRGPGPDLQVGPQNREVRPGYRGVENRDLPETGAEIPGGGRGEGCVGASPVYTKRAWLQKSAP